jgi:hypothetical protein
MGAQRRGVGQEPPLRDEQAGLQYAIDDSIEKKEVID